MTFREDLETRFTADHRPFASGASAVERRLARLDGTVRSRLDRIDRRWERSARAVEGFRNTVSRLAIGAGLLEFGRQAVRVAGNFEAAMNRVKAASGATAAQIDALKSKARELGQVTSFSATEAADAIEVLTRNGVGVDQILGGALEASLKLASATGGDLAQSADLATDVMAQFGYQAEQLPGVVDLITGAMVNSKFGFADFALAIGQGGAVAAQAGVPLEEFAAAIAGTAQAFTSGSDAGTSFKTFVAALTGNSKEARAAIEALGLEFFDAGGNLRPLGEIAEELRRGLSGLTEEARTSALKTIFGNDSMRTAAELGKLGAEGFRELQAAIAGVSAADQAAARMAGFEGATKRAAAAWENMLLTIGDNGGLSVGTAAVEALAAALNTLAENFPVIAAGAAAVAGSRGLGALTSALAAARAAAVQKVAAAEAEVRAARLATLAANQELVRRQQAVAMLEREGAATRRLEAAKRSLGQATIAAAAAGERQVRAVGALTAAQGRLSTASRLTSGAMGALRGAMAFLGGPIGLAITAVTVGITALASSSADAGAEMSDLSYQSGELMGALDSVRSAAEAYSAAIAATATAQSEASDRIVAETEREFNAKKQLFELAVKRQKSLQAERAARVSQLEAEIARRPVLTGKEGGAAAAFASAENRRKLAECEERAAAAREEITRLRAMAELAAIDIERSEAAIAAGFTPGEKPAVGGGGGGRSIDLGGGGGGGATVAGDPFGASAERVRGLEAEAVVVGQVGSALAFLEERERILAELRQSDLELTPERIAQAEAAAAVYALQAQEVDNLKAAEALYAEYRAKAMTDEEKRNQLLEQQAALREQLVELTGSQAEADKVLAFQADKIESEFSSLERVGKSVGDAIGRAFEDVASDLDNAGEAAKRLAINIASLLLKATLTPIFEGIGSAIGAGIGFDGGGFTGQGGRLEPAGVVHREEFVVRAPFARRFRPALEAMNEGRLPGFAGGGFVNRAPSVAAPRVPVVPAATAAPSLVFAPSTHIAVSGGDGDVIDRIKPELDRRDAALRREIPAKVALLNAHNPKFLGD